MDAQDTAPAYYIWGVDSNAYGPIDLPTLVSWIKDGRVIANTWVYVEAENGWRQACEIPELSMFFKASKAGASANGCVAQDDAIKPGALRRIKALADMTDEQLTTLLGFIEVVQVRPFCHVVRKGEPGDAMYGILEGELRSCVTVDGKECLLATLGPGGVFGEISLFDKGPHAADVISNEESVLVMISAAAVTRVSKEAPEAGLAMLLGLVKTIAGRVRTLTRRYEESVHTAHQNEALQLT
jgi:hypothetical protein